MNKENNLQEELTGLAKKLANPALKKQGFEVPIDYFKDFQDKFIAEQVVNEVKSKPVKNPQKNNWLEQFIHQLSWLLQPRIAVAMAAFLVVFLSFFLFRTETAHPIGTIALEEISTEELQTFVLSNIEYFEESTLIREEDDFENPYEQHESYEEVLDELLEDTDLSSLEELL